MTYRVEAAERIGLPDASVDLVTAAQAAHWFDLGAFYAEVRRVARPDAVLALASYGVPTMDGPVGAMLDRFYWHDIHAFWPDGRRHVEAGYRTRAFPFCEESLPRLSITRDWSLDELTAYILIWSATKHAVAAGEGNIVTPFLHNLDEVWGAPERRLTVTWPVHARVARVYP